MVAKRPARPQGRMTEPDSEGGVLERQERDPTRLSLHPEFERLFAPPEPEDVERLAASMAEGAPIAPLLVTAGDQVLAGCEQWRAALRLGGRRISVVLAPDLPPAELRALMVAENIRTTEIRAQHLNRGMNNFFDMEPLRPPGGW